MRSSLCFSISIYFPYLGQGREELWWKERRLPEIAALRLGSKLLL